MRRALTRAHCVICRHEIGYERYFYRTEDGQVICEDCVDVWSDIMATHQTSGVIVHNLLDYAGHSFTVEQLDDLHAAINTAVRVAYPDTLVVLAWMTSHAPKVVNGRTLPRYSLFGTRQFAAARRGRLVSNAEAEGIMRMIDGIIETFVQRLDAAR